jgi:phosphinothricin acetyltransferase
MKDIVIRPAIEADVPAINSIYNEYIIGSHVSFDTEAWNDEQRLAWFRDRVSLGYPVLVACEGDRVIGTSWSGPYRPKKAYRRSAETTVALTDGMSGRGIGTAMHTVLIDHLKVAGFHRAYAIIALPNDASIALHRKLGYREVGVFDESGFKDGKFHSTMMMELALNG